MPAPAEPTIPTGVYEQPEKSLANNSGAKTITRRFKGPHADLITFANGYTIGQTEHDGLPLQSVKLDRIVGNPTDGNLGVLELTFSKDDQGQGGSKNAAALNTTWQLKHTQTNISIYRYCGQSEGASANRGRIEQWRRGTDAYLYANYKWRDKNGAVLELTARDKLIAAKFMAGKENVMRFYPTIQKVTRYTAGKIANIGAGLLDIGAPAGAPAGFPTADWQWMLIGDDLTFDTASGVQTRTQTWLGAEAFDTDFYGSARWQFGSI